MRVIRKVDPSCVWAGDRPSRWFVFLTRKSEWMYPKRIGLYKLGGKFEPEPGSGLPTVLAPQDESPYGRWDFVRQRLESIIAHQPKEAR